MEVELAPVREPLLVEQTPADASKVASQPQPQKNKQPTSLSSSSRTIRLTGHCSGLTPNTNNSLSNTKYTVLTFIPTVLYNQFKFFFNIFFLCLCISQFFDSFKVGLMFAYVAPLVFVLVMTMIREAYDDIKRFI